MSAVDRSRLPAIGASPSYRFPSVARTRLSNGLRLWSVEQRGLPVLTLLLLVPAGAAADPEARPGLASLAGDMLDEGSGERSALDVHDALARIGAQFDTEVGADATIIGLTTLSRFADRALDLLGDLAVRPSMRQEDFERVRELRLNRLIQLRDHPPATADRAFVRLLYGKHPYGHIALGTEETLRQISLQEAIQFHRRAYRPAEATLIAVGDLDDGTLLQGAERAFGGWRDAENPDSAAVTARRALARPIPPPAEPLVVVDRPGAAQSELRIGHVGVARDTPDYHALLVLNMILGGQFVSRINLNLREEKGFTYGARTAFDFRRGPGPFVLQVSVQTGVTAEAIAEALKELEAIRESRPATDGELALACAALTRGYPRNFETADQIARAVAQLAMFDLPDDSFERFVPSVEQVDRAAVTRVARAHLDPSRMLTLVVGDRDAIGPSLAGAGLGEPAALSLVESGS